MASRSIRATRPRSTEPLVPKRIDRVAGKAAEAAKAPASKPPKPAAASVSVKASKASKRTAPKAAGAVSAAKAPARGRGRSLVIVESPAKARTIAKYLGSGFEVKASNGHVRD